MSSRRIAQERLDQIVPALAERLAKLPIGTLQTVLDIVESGTPASSGPSTSAASLDALADQILRAPVSGSRLGAVQAAVVRHALITTEGNVSAAARLLGMERKALARMARRMT